LVNLAAVVPAILALAFFGRKTLMCFWVAIMSASMFMMWITTTYFMDKNTGWVEIVLNCVYIVGFECSFGPIFWIYIAEVCTYKGMSIALVVSWICSLLISFTTPYLFADACLSTYTFLLFGVICLLALFFFIVFMKETKGLSHVQCKRLYASAGAYGVTPCSETVSDNRRSLVS